MPKPEVVRRDASDSTAGDEWDEHMAMHHSVFVTSPDWHIVLELPFDDIGDVARQMADWMSAGVVLQIASETAPACGCHVTDLLNLRGAGAITIITIHPDEPAVEGQLPRLTHRTALSALRRNAIARE